MPRLALYELSIHVFLSYFWFDWNSEKADSTRHRRRVQGKMGKKENKNKNLHFSFIFLDFLVQDQIGWLHQTALAYKKEEKKIKVTSRKMMRWNFRFGNIAACLMAKVMEFVPRSLRSKTLNDNSATGHQQRIISTETTWSVPDNKLLSSFKCFIYLLVRLSSYFFLAINCREAGKKKTSP